MDVHRQAELLFVVGHREPVFEQNDPRPDQHPLGLGHRPVKILPCGPRCRSPSRARRPRNCTSCDETARSRQPPEGATIASAPSFGAGRAATRHVRGLRRRLIRLMNATLVRRNPAVEQNDDLPSIVLDPVLKTHQLMLEFEQGPETEARWSDCSLCSASAKRLSSLLSSISISRSSSKLPAPSSRTRSRSDW